MKKTILTIITLLNMMFCYAQFQPVPSTNNLFHPAGNVGIRVANPGSILDMRIDLLNDQFGIRLTYPTPPLGGTIVNRELLRVGPNDFLVTRSGVSINTSVLPNDVKLHVSGGFTLLDGNQASILFDKSSSSTYGQWGIEYDVAGSNSGLNFWKPSGSNNYGNYYMFLSDDGNVGIGTNEPEAKLDIPDGNVFIGQVDLTSCSNCQDYQLFVRKGIRTEKVKVDLAPGLWSDYVFENNYKLKSLEEVQSFITENGHLPDVPSACELEETGLDLAEMDAVLLRKIEELTLYLLQLQKDYETVKAELIELKK